MSTASDITLVVRVKLRWMSCVSQCVQSNGPRTAELDVPSTDTNQFHNKRSRQDGHLLGVCPTRTLCPAATGIACMLRHLRHSTATHSSCCRPERPAHDHIGNCRIPARAAHSDILPSPRHTLVVSNLRQPDFVFSTSVFRIEGQRHTDLMLPPVLC